MRRSNWARLAAGLIALAGVLVVVVLLLSSGHSQHRPSAPPGPAGPPRPSEPPRPATPFAEEFGVNVNRLFDDRTYSSAQIDAQLQALRATGATVARSDALWEVAEPSPPEGTVHHHNWSFDDAVAGALASHGLRWFAILDYSAAWARAQPALLHSPPRSPQEFATFAAAFAARYGRGGAFWRQHPKLPDLPVETYEVWNEPDNRAFWQPFPSASAYADLYLAARDTIARVDPSARVIVGGLVRPASFLAEMLRAQPGLGQLIEGVAIHPYGRDPAVVIARVRTARQAMAALGLSDVPLYVTEFGWTTHPQGTLNFAPATRRPGYIAGSLAALGHTDCEIAATLLYTWVTPERNPARKEDWFGIHPPSGASSPDTAAFAAGMRAATQPAPRQPACGPT